VQKPSEPARMALACACGAVQVGKADGEPSGGQLMPVFVRGHFGGCWARRLSRHAAELPGVMRRQQECQFTRRYDENGDSFRA
jgi:hypothetical protein